MPRPTSKRLSTLCLIMMALLIITVSGRAGESAQAPTVLDGLEYKLELSRHQQLLEQKQRPGVNLTPFTTDGCSGGLSVGWLYLSDTIEALRNNHGEHPPWESCCITHDRAYHQAGGSGINTDQSFSLRRQADESLKNCVLEVGAERASELTKQYGLSAREVGLIYQGIADLMYRAVRLGGIPCSGLPWRWGYGWPACD